MNMPFPYTGAVVLGAGASSRMGRPKLLLPWQGTTVIGHIISQWRELGVGQIAIVHRPDDAALFTELDRLDFPKADRIENPHPGNGMFSSIVCAANWDGWKPGIMQRAIALGDQPHLPTQMLSGLLDFATQNPSKICQPAHSGRAGHPVVLPDDVFGGLRCTDEVTLKDFLKPFSGCTVQFPVTDIGLSLDLDTPEDYKRFTADK
jgi:molybdenum cofactor cytidylyltransferase